LETLYHDYFQLTTVIFTRFLRLGNIVELTSKNIVVFDGYLDTVIFRCSIER